MLRAAHKLLVLYRPFLDNFVKPFLVESEVHHFWIVLFRHFLNACYAISGPFSTAIFGRVCVLLYCLNRETQC